MHPPLSLDLRERIAAALHEGATVRAAADRFGVSVSSAVRLGQRMRSGRGLAPAKAGGGGKPILTGDVADWLRGRLEEKRDLTMRALAAELCERGTQVTHDTVWRFVRREGLTFKKNPGGERTGPAGGGAVPGALESPPAPGRA